MISDSKYQVDDLCLATFLEGVCLKYLKAPEQAETCFKEVIVKSEKCKDDLYLAPYALMEYGMSLKEKGEKKAAMQQFEKAK